MVERNWPGESPIGGRFSPPPNPGRGDGKTVDGVVEGVVVNDDAGGSE